MSRPVLWFLVVLLGTATPARADFLYTYTGNPFQTWTGETCAGDCALNIALAVPELLPSNFVASTVGERIQIRPGPNITFTMGDGLTQVGFTAAGFEPPGAHPFSDLVFIHATDSVGLPSSWDIGIDTFIRASPPSFKRHGVGSVHCLTSLCSSIGTFGISDGLVLRHLAEAFDPGEIVYEAGNRDAVGTWRVVAVSDRPIATHFGSFELLVGLALLMIVALKMQTRLLAGC